jgi:hypothetical protein
MEDFETSLICVDCVLSYLKAFNYFLLDLVDKLIKV